MNISQLNPSILVAGYTTRTKKRFGQHFLTDPNILNRVLDAASVSDGDVVVEIGPGPGTLTIQLLHAGASVTAIEIDDDAAGYLKRNFGDHIALIHGDALELDLGTILPAKAKVVANLPYNVATEIVFRLTTQMSKVERMALMFQKEVAQRICAEPGSKKFGRLAVMVQTRWDVSLAFTLPPGAFSPPPKVDSAVVKFTPRENVLVKPDDASFDVLVRAAFNQRRKALPNALSAVYDKTKVAETMVSMGLDARARAETVSVVQFVELRERLAIA